MINLENYLMLLLGLGSQTVQILLPNFWGKSQNLYLFSQIQPTHKILVTQILILKKEGFWYYN